MILRGFAHIISLVFHPIFMASYMLLLLMWVNPFLFGGQEMGDSIKLLVLIFPTSALIPIICIVLMKPLGFIENFHMESRQERIIPYVSTGILYLWLFINLYHQKHFPMAYTISFLGGLIALFIAFFINNFSKISAHCVGVGGLLGMTVLARMYYSYPTVQLNLGTVGSWVIDVDYILIAVILLAGIIGTARLVLNAHERADIYGGYVVGFSSQLIAFQVMNIYGT